MNTIVRGSLWIALAISFLYGSIFVAPEAGARTVVGYIEGAALAWLTALSFLRTPPRSADFVLAAILGVAIVCLFMIELGAGKPQPDPFGMFTYMVMLVLTVFGLARLLYYERLLYRFCFWSIQITAIFALFSIASVLGVDDIFGYRMSIKLGVVNFSGFPATGGIYSHYINFGTQCAFSLIFMLWAYVTRGEMYSLRGKLAVPIFVLCLIGLIVSQSRTGFLALGLGGLALLFLVDRRAKMSRQYFGIVSGAALVGMFGLLTGLAYIERYLRIEQGGSRRGEIWAVAVDRWREQPAYGYGWNASGVVGEQWAVISWLSADTHNTYINVLYDLGVVGFACLVSLLIFSLGGMAKIVDRNRRALVVALILAMGAAAAFVAQTPGGIRSVSLLFTMVIGYGLWAGLCEKRVRYHAVAMPRRAPSPAPGVP